MSDEDQETKAGQLQELLENLKQNYPLIEPMVRSRVNHWKRRSAGLIGAAVVACELLQVVFA